MRKAFLAMLMATTLMAADTVYVTANGKTYHKSATCGILARSSHIYQADKAQAEAHGLKPCRSCYAAHKANNGAWAKEVKK